MKTISQIKVNNYIIDCMGLEKNELTFQNLTESQKQECIEFNS